MTIRHAGRFRLVANPAQADAWCEEGNVHAAEGRARQAERAYRRALMVRPDFAEAHNNLGNVLRAQNRVEEAVVSYRQALSLGLHHPLVYDNLGMAQRQAGQSAEAYDAFRHALAMAPDYAEANNNLGNLLREQDWLEDAVTVYLRALALRPDYADAHSNLAGTLYLLHESGGVAAASRAARTWLSRHPDDAFAQHIGGAILGDGAGPQRASDDYVRQAFDDFAAEFDDKLASLDYRAPDLIARLLAEMLPTGARTLDVLDAGCGTGLCGASLRPLARRLVGVDLSSGMLARAGARGLYDSLEEAELGSWLAANAEGFDLIVGADVFCYFGTLGEVLAQAGAALRPGGLILFTAERLDGEGDFRVNPHGRYSHAESYIRRSLEDAGLTVQRLEPETLRYESGRPVEGWLVAAAR